MATYQRQYYLDWLRIAAIIGVLFYHSAQPFVPEEHWHIMNGERSNLLMEFNYMLSKFRMPLLFFISGTVSFFMLKKYGSGKEFIKQRFIRLFLPLVAGMLIIVPPQVYLERVSNGYTGSFLDFYPSIFRFQPYPEGNFSWHHLWFIAYLFIYDIICVPLFLWMMKDGKNGLNKLAAWLSTKKRVYLLALPGILLFASLVLRFPFKNNLIEDGCAFFYWLWFLLVGFFMIVHPSLLDSLERNRKTSMLIATLLYLTVNYIRWNEISPWDIYPDNTTSYAYTYLYLSLTPAIAWSMVMGLVGYGKKYLNRKHSFLNYGNEVLYPFYILHQTVIVIIAFYVVQTGESILAKYLFIVLLTFITCMALIHFLVRPTNALRWIFGMKPVTKAPKQVQHNATIIEKNTALIVGIADLRNSSADQ